jgi:predicted transglutaminase-like cysteine proteinase
VARFLGVFLACLMFGMQGAEAKPAQQPFVPSGTATDMPTGLAELCRAQPATCDRLAATPAPTVSTAVSTTGPDSPDADKTRLRLLKRIDGMVNARVRQQSDMLSYGVGELWRPSGSGRNAVGDCEDLAIEKRLELIDAGFPPERLFFAVVYQSGIGLHTVLVARLDGGDMVLDSRSSFVEPWQDTRYQWLIAEHPGMPTRWTTAS